MPKLKELANIRTGYSLKGKIKEYATGEFKILQPKDISDHGLEEAGTFVDPHVYPSIDNHVLSPEDIGLSNKGLNIKSLIFDQNNLFSPTILSSSFFMIRVFNKQINPYYLLWYLQQDQTIENLKQLMKGGAVPSLSKKDLGQLEIPIISMEDQNKIVTLQKQLEMESEKLNKIIQNGSELLTSFGWNLINKIPIYGKQKEKVASNN